MKKGICLLLAVLMLSLAGCGEKTEPANPSPTPEKVADITIGNQTDEGYELLLKNSTGLDITAIMIKTAQQEEYPANMMGETAVWKQGETAQVFYTPETTLSETESDKVINTLYQAKFVLSDGTEVELSSLGLDDIDGEAELLFEDEVAFVSYKSKLVGTPVSTKEQELGAKAQREAESSAEEPIVYEEPAVQQPVYTEPAPAPQAPVQAEEGCLTDVEIVNP